MISDRTVPAAVSELAWSRALTLSERIAALRSGPLGRVEDASWAKADHRLDRWRSQAPFTDDRWFAERLAMDGLGEEELRTILASPPGGAEAGEPPRWWRELLEAFSSGRTRAPVEPPEDLEEMAGLFPAVEPLIAWKLEQVRARIDRLAAAPGLTPFAPASAERLVLLALPKRTAGAVSRTLALELNVARLEGRLRGETPEARFRSFMESLTAPGGMEALFEEYPVLGRLIVQRAHAWLDAGVEFLEHLKADWPLLVETFAAGTDPGPLTELQGGVGDRHRGREVLIATFASGLRIVYKPRSMAVDLHFQELLAWLNERGQEPALRTVAVLDRGDHGWMEFVVRAACSRREEVHRFYRRQGAYLALLYAIEASDFHSENLIAAGEHPVLIDLESLFQAQVWGMDAQQSDLIAAHALGRSVLQVGLLPQRIWADHERDGIDLSGLGGQAGQINPHAMPYWESASTDSMRLARRQEEIPEGHHRPQLAGEDVDLLDFVDDLVEGFRETYLRLMESRDELLAEDGPLACFAGDEVRSILRPTQVYGVLLIESFHPDFLRDALDRDRHFDRLWVAVQNRPFLTRIIPAERDDLWRGDVPIFTTRPCSRDLFTSTGERIPDFFDDQTGFDLVRDRVRQLSEEDLDRQLWFLRASLVALTLDLETALWPSYEVQPPKRETSRERLLAQAVRIGDHLARLSIRNDGEATWIGLVTEMGHHPSLVPLKLDLYSGLPGVALFFAHLGVLTGEARFEEIARETVRGVRRLVRKDPALVPCIGAFGGWGGLIYALTRLAVLWKDPDLLREAESTVETVLPRIEEDPHYDLIAGAAGCLGSLLALHAHSPSERTLAAALACGDHLLARAVPAEPYGIGWLPGERGQVPWGGMAHGNAGHALALLRLAAATGEERFRTAALQAMAYERTLFNPAVGNWRDARDLEALRMAVRIENEIYMTAWCHGSTGLGLARLAGLSLADDAEIRAEIDAALADTLKNGFGQNHSLCHGDLGNIELLTEAARLLDEARWRPEVERLAASILDSMDERGWLCGVALGVQTPGLMTGLAGIGYGLLRLADPERVPSVLVLEPPSTRSAAPP